MKFYHNETGSLGLKLQDRLLRVHRNRTKGKKWTIGSLTTGQTTTKAQEHYAQTFYFKGERSEKNEYCKRI